MRVTLKHLIPLVLLLNPVLAASKDEPTETVTSVESTSAAAKTTPKITSTSKDAPSSTEESATTATGDSKDENKDETSSSKTESKTSAVTKATKTEEVETEVDTWVPSAPATLAPDLNAGAVSLMDRHGLLSLGFALGAVSVGMALL